jgi:hypothetical protein
MIRLIIITLTRRLTKMLLGTFFFSKAVLLLLYRKLIINNVIVGLMAYFYEEGNYKAIIYFFCYLCFVTFLIYLSIRYGFPYLYHIAYKDSIDRFWHEFVKWIKHW